MLSDESRQVWQRLTAEEGGGGAFDRLALAPFIVGLHRRGEEWTAHDLGLLLDQLDLAVADKDGLVAYVEAALALLAAYDVALQGDDEADDDEEDDDGEFGFSAQDPPLGYLVI